MVTTFTTPIKTTQNQLDLVGGKGRSLARMSCADFDVPGGFLVTTDAYKKFINDVDNNLFEDKKYSVSMDDEVLDKLRNFIDKSVIK